MKGENPRKWSKFAFFGWAKGIRPMGFLSDKFVITVFGVELSNVVLIPEKSELTQI